MSEIEGTCEGSACAVPPVPEEKVEAPKHEPKPTKAARKPAPRKEVKTMPKKTVKKSHAGKEKKRAVALGLDAMKKARQIRAKREMETGERVTIGEAVAYALDQVRVK